MPMRARNRGSRRPFDPARGTRTLAPPLISSTAAIIAAPDPSDNDRACRFAAMDAGPAGLVPIQTAQLRLVRDDVDLDDAA
ncbi:MAG TPA: hypothetical protein VFP30_07350, partial [Candidatus Limnocylindria bacterium]|nr:hypothetical protein [Candidatus Limnocylindria bacterium]